MILRSGRAAALGLILLLSTATAGLATDGHFFQGVGAVNAAMGGAGVAAPVSLLGTFYLNPAGLMAFGGSRVEVSIEMRKSSASLASGLGGDGSSSFMPLASESLRKYRPAPALAMSHQLGSEKVTFGLAVLETGGFTTNYATSHDNPILRPQPDGLGPVNSDYRMMWAAPAIAVAPTDNLWIGASALLGWASLSMDPALTSPPADDYYSSAAVGDEAFGFGFQVGVLWNVNDMIALGGSYTSEQSFENFEFASTYASPDLLNFGDPRPLVFDLHVPAVLSGGLAMTPLPEMLMSADVRYIFYENTKGFKVEGDSPVSTDGAVEGFGWKNTLVLAFGLQYELSERVFLRGGYNYAGKAIEDELQGVNVQLPQIINHHASVGLGYRPSRRFEISAGYYHGFKRSQTGPWILPDGAPNGAAVTNTLSENSFQLQFTMATRGL